MKIENQWWTQTSCHSAQSHVDTWNRNHFSNHSNKMERRTTARERGKWEYVRSTDSFTITISSFHIFPIVVVVVVAVAICLTNAKPFVCLSLSLFLCLCCFSFLPLLTLVTLADRYVLHINDVFHSFFFYFSLSTSNSQRSQSEGEREGEEREIIIVSIFICFGRETCFFFQQPFATLVSMSRSLRTTAFPFQGFSMSSGDIIDRYSTQR